MKHFEKQRKYLELENTTKQINLITIVSDVSYLSIWIDSKIVCMDS